MQWLKDELDRQDCFAFYHHTKGITTLPTDPRYPARVDWRLCMQYFCVERWKDMVSALAEGHDVGGISWRRLFIRDFHFRRPRMDPLYTRKPQRPRESFSSHNRPGSEAVTQPALTSWG